MMKVKTIDLEKQKQKADRILQGLYCYLSGVNVIDIGDIGNEIGLFIGKNVNKKIGFTKEDFMSGLNHGFNLAKDHVI